MTTTTASRKTGNPATDRAAREAAEANSNRSGRSGTSARQEPAKPIVTPPDPKTQVVAKMESKTVAKRAPKGTRPAPKAAAKPEPATVKVKLSFATLTVPARDLSAVHVTTTTADFLAWVEAAYGADLSALPREVLSVIATGKPAYQAAVRDANPNALSSPRRGQK